MDLIVGAAVGYSKEDTEPWYRSLERTGYKGATVVITECAKTTHPIVDRFRIVATLSNKHPLRFVVATDVKDLVFQSDPIRWLEENLGDHTLAVQSEGQLYRHCRGNRKNMLEAFGEEAYLFVEEEPVLNAGVIAGRAEAVAELCRDIYDMCLSDRRKNVRGKTWDDMLPDQAALNFILRMPKWSDALICAPESGFVSEYQHTLPREIRNGVVYPVGSDVPYVMWHQYWWADGIREKYKNAKTP